MEDTTTLHNTTTVAVVVETHVSTTPEHVPTTLAVVVLSNHEKDLTINAVLSRE